MACDPHVTVLGNLPPAPDPIHCRRAGRLCRTRSRVTLPPYPNWQRKRIQIPFSVSSSLTGGTVWHAGRLPTFRVGSFPRDRGHADPVDVVIASAPCSPMRSVANRI